MTINDTSALVNGVRSLTYKHIGQYAYNFTLGHVGFIAEREDGSSAVVYNGKEIAAPYEEVYDLSMPERGTLPRYAFIAKRGERSMAVIDGVPGKLYDYIGRLQFTEDGSGTLYEAVENNKSFVVHNGKEGKRYRSVSLVPDSWTGKDRVAFQAQEDCGIADTNINCPTFVVVDGVEGKRYDQIQEFSTRASSDGKHFAYVGIKNHRSVLVMDGKEGTWYDSIDGKLEPYYETFFSPLGDHSAFVAKQGASYFVVLDGKEGKPYKFINHLNLSLDGSHISYVASKKCDEDQINESIYKADRGNPCDILIVTDGNEIKPNLPPVQINISNNKAKLAYVITGSCQSDTESLDGLVCESQVVFNNKPGKKYTAILGQIYTSPQGKHIAYIAGDSRRDYYTLVVDEQEYPLRSLSDTDSTLGNIFSPDDAHIFLALPKDGKIELWIDGQKVQTHDAILEEQFSEDGKQYTYIYKQGNDINLGKYEF